MLDNLSGNQRCVSQEDSKNFTCRKPVSVSPDLTSLEDLVNASDGLHDLFSLEYSEVFSTNPLGNRNRNQFRPYYANKKFLHAFFVSQENRGMHFTSRFAHFSGN